MTTPLADGKEIGWSLFLPGIGVADAWRVGDAIAYQIVRDGHEQTVAVPLVRWTPEAIVGYSLAGVTNLSNWLGTLILLGTGAWVFFRRPQEVRR